MTRRPRYLSAEERELWDRVRQNAVPLQPKRFARGLPPKAAAEHSPFEDAPQRKTATRLPSFRIGEKQANGRPADDLAPSLAERLSTEPLRMDRKSYARLKRGKLAPEARLDLHGMTLDRAHPALNRFILLSQMKGRRLVLVITGKGKERDEDGPMPVRRGVLRHQVPQWLAGPELAHAVLQVTEAHQRHGGCGAYYVYLRRHR